LNTISEKIVVAIVQPAVCSTEDGKRVFRGNDDEEDGEDDDDVEEDDGSFCE
jgi:hypothetical protein